MIKCCGLGCKNDAKYILWDEPFVDAHSFKHWDDTYFYSCGAHVDDLWGDNTVALEVLDAVNSVEQAIRGPE